MAEWEKRVGSQFLKDFVSRKDLYRDYPPLYEWREEQLCDFCLQTKFQYLAMKDENVFDTSTWQSVEAQQAGDFFFQIEDHPMSLGTHEPQVS